MGDKIIDQPTTSETTVYGAASCDFLATLLAHNRRGAPGGWLHHREQDKGLNYMQG